MTKNLTYIKPEFFRHKVDSNSGKLVEISDTATRKTKGNASILEHNQKRIIEAKLFELQDSLIEKGVGDLDIEKIIAQAREDLEGASQQYDATSKASEKKNSHVIAAMKEAEIAKVRSAFGIRSDYEEGVAFDQKKQELLRESRKLETEKSEIERRRRYENNENRDRDSVSARDSKSDRDGRDVGLERSRDGYDRGGVTRDRVRNRPREINRSRSRDRRHSRSRDRRHSRSRDRRSRSRNRRSSRSRDRRS